MSDAPALVGIDELRKAVDMLNNCNESFLNGGPRPFTPGQLLTICRAWKACEWDIWPDQWEGAPGQARAPRNRSDVRGERQRPRADLPEGRAARQGDAMSEPLALGTYESGGVFPTENDVYDGANMIIHDPCLGVPFTPEMARLAARILRPEARRRLRAMYDAAEYRLIAAIADRKAIMCASDYRELTDEELASLDIATSAVDGCRAMVEDARRACEAADVVVNTHAAMPHL